MDLFNQIVLKLGYDRVSTQYCYENFVCYVKSVKLDGIYFNSFKGGMVSDKAKLLFQDLSVHTSKPAS